MSAIRIIRQPLLTGAFLEVTVPTDSSFVRTDSTGKKFRVRFI